MTTYFFLLSQLPLLLVYVSVFDGSLSEIDLVDRKTENLLSIC